MIYEAMKRHEEPSMHITKRKNPMWKDYIQYDSAYMIFWKGKTIETVKDQ